MRKKMLVAMLIAVACVFFAGGIYAKVADVVKVENKACQNTKGEIQFSHSKHSDEYAKKFAKLYPNGCGECHHDDKGKPLAGLTADSKVQKCMECHKKTNV